MINASPEFITFAMLGLLLVGLMSGYPLAIPVGFAGLLVGLLLYGTDVVGLFYTRIATLLLSYTLLAVPCFVFMGFILSRSGIADRIYEALYDMLGGIRGGLAVATVLIGTVLAACMGIVGASITLLTIFALPSMLKRGYSKSLATGSVCAGGTLGVLIPPSILLVIYGTMASVSVGKLFFGAVIPGLLLSLSYSIYVLIRSYLRPNDAPAVPASERTASLTLRLNKLAKALVPPGILIFSVLGSIFFGIAPPTEASAIGAFVSILLIAAYRKFSFKVLQEATLETFRVTGMILLTAVMAYAFTGIFLGAGCGKVVESFVLSSPLGPWGSFFLIMFIIFLLGFVIDILGIIFIMVPIVAPLVTTLGFDPIWFALMININFQMAYMTPPFAVAIFYLRGVVAPELGVTMGDTIRGVVPFVVIIMLVIVLCAVFPDIILWLPGRMIQ